MSLMNSSFNVVHSEYMQAVSNRIKHHYELPPCYNWELSPIFDKIVKNIKYSMITSLELIIELNFLNVPD